jgi:hypothetical protein
MNSVAPPDKTVAAPVALRGRSIAIIPFPTLGDTTIYLRLAHTLSLAGARLRIYSDLLASADDLFPWAEVLPLADHELADISRANDLVIADILAPKLVAHRESDPSLSSPGNLLAVTAKRPPSGFTPPAIPVLLAGSGAANPHAPFCRSAQYGPSMVDWVDRYAAEVFGLSAPPCPPPVVPPPDWVADGDAARRVLLFPLTPNPSKNYSLSGFARLAGRLEKNGWNAEIVCMPHEAETMSARLGADSVRVFPSLRDLILHMRQSSAVISNDSGGGHLGSMLGLRTFTITKKAADFVWRPGFNGDNMVVSPVMTFKWINGRVWRPFIPLRKIIDALGQAPQ